MGKLVDTVMDQLHAEFHKGYGYEKARDRGTTDHYIITEFNMLPHTEVLQRIEWALQALGVLPQDG